MSHPNNFLRHAAATFAFGLMLASPAAMAEASSMLVIGVDKTRIYNLPEPAGGVILGNPEIVSVSLHDISTVVLTGRAPGETELIVLDRGGAVMRQFDLAVTRVNANEITVVRGELETFLSCGEKCVPVPTR